MGKIAEYVKKVIAEGLKIEVGDEDNDPSNHAMVVRLVFFGKVISRAFLPDSSPSPYDDYDDNIPF